MLKNAYLLAKIGADTAENERNLAEFLPKIGKRRQEGRGEAARRPQRAAAAAAAAAGLAGDHTLRGQTEG